MRKSNCLPLSKVAVAKNNLDRAGIAELKGEILIWN
jgi:hypothetical protein